MSALQGRKVCKRWNAMILFTDMTLQYPFSMLPTSLQSLRVRTREGSGLAFADMTKSLPRAKLSRLVIDLDNGIALQAEPLSPCPYISSVEVRHLYVPLHVFPNLTDLCFHACVVNAFEGLSSLVNLTSLRVSLMGLVVSCFESISTCLGLERLEFDQCAYHGEGLPQFSNLTKLREYAGPWTLLPPGCRVSRADFSAHSNTNFPRRSITHVHFDEEVPALSVLEKIDDVQELSFSRISAFREDSLHLLHQTIGSLLHLTIPVTSQDLALLSLFRNLRSLFVTVLKSSGKRNAGRQVECESWSWPHLVKLRVECWSDIDITALLGMCPELVDLTLFHDSARSRQRPLTMSKVTKVRFSGRYQFYSLRFPILQDFGEDNLEGGETPLLEFLSSSAGTLERLHFLTAVSSGFFQTLGASNVRELTFERGSFPLETEELLSFLPNLASFRVPSGTLDAEQVRYFRNHDVSVVLQR